MRRYEEPQIKCAMFSSVSISAAANASQAADKTNLREWFEKKQVMDGVAVVNWAEMDK